MWPGGEAQPLSPAAGPARGGAAPSNAARRGCPRAAAKLVPASPGQSHPRPPPLPAHRALPLGSSRRPPPAGPAPPATSPRAPSRRWRPPRQARPRRGGDTAFFTGAGARSLGGRWPAHGSGEPGRGVAPAGT